MLDFLIHPTVTLETDWRLPGRSEEAPHELVTLFVLLLSPVTVNKT